MNYQLLKGQIKKYYGTEQNFCKEVLKMTQTNLSRKYKDESFSNKDIKIICKALHINKNEIGDYFFDF